MLEGWSGWELYILAAISFSLTTIYTVQLPAYVSAKKELVTKGIHTGKLKFFSKTFVAIQSIFFTLFVAALFPVCALAVFISNEGAVSGYSDSLVKHALQEVDDDDNDLNNGV